MGERNVVRTAEVYRAYSGIAAATVSGVLRMSPMARERSTSAAWPSRSVAFVVSLCLDPRPPDSLTRPDRAGTTKSTNAR